MKKESIFLVILGIIVLTFILSFFSLNKNNLPNIANVYNNQNNNERINNERIKQTNVDINQILGTLPPIGNPQAPIKIVEFGDFHCPFCAQVLEVVINNLKTYIDEGKVAIYFRDFPLDSIHPFSRNVHLASRCANEQGKYWDFHKKVFSDFLNGLGQKTGEKDYLLKLTKELNLNEENFKSCYESKKYEKEINEDYLQGIQLGVQGTPAFFVNNLFIAGLDPQSIMEAINIIQNRK